MRRRTPKHLWVEFSEIDYLKKLSKEDREWMLQFMFEYYVGDFNFESPIHTKDYWKECRVRNNAVKRQITAVGSRILRDSIQKAVDIQTGNSNHLKPRFYTPYDYIKDLVKDIDDDKDTK